MNGILTMNNKYINNLFQLDLLKNKKKMNYKKKRINDIKKTNNNVDNISNNLLDILRDDIKFMYKNDITNENIIYLRNNKCLLHIKEKNYDYVIKFFDIKNYDDFDETKEVYEILKNKNIKYVANHINFVIKDKYGYIIYEYIMGMNLKEYILKNELTYDMIMKIFFQIVDALDELHKLNIIHCDLKLQNIMINSDNNIKIIDFDLSKKSENDHVSEYQFGTSQYMAPESFDLNIHSKKTDIWELGIILYYLITKDFPYENELDYSDSKYNSLRRNKFKYPNMEKIKDKINKLNFPEWIYNLACGMLEFQDNKRFSIEKINEFRKYYLIK